MVRGGLRFPRTIRSRGLPRSRPCPCRACARVGHDFEAHQVLGLLVAELALDPQAQRRAVRHRQVLAVHAVGQDGLRVEGVNEVDALVVEAGAVEGLLQVRRRSGTRHSARRLREPGVSQQHAQRDAGPLADGAPALDAVVARDLGAGRQRLQVGERQAQGLADQPVHREPPVGELGLRRASRRRRRPASRCRSSGRPATGPPR